MRKFLMRFYCFCHFMCYPKYLEELNEFSDGELSTKHDNNEKLKCYMFCILHALGEVEFTSEEYDGLDDIPDEIYEKLEELFNQCEDIGGDSDCEFAYNLNKCWKQYDPQVCFDFHSFLMILVICFNIFSSIFSF